MLHNLKIGTRVSLIVATAVAGMVVVMAAGLIALRSELMLDRQNSLRNIVESAVSIAEGYAAMAAAGEMTTEEAQAAAAMALRTMRYADGEYLFAVEQGGDILVHPIRPALEGTAARTITDANGTAFLDDLLAEVTPAAGAFVRYWWPRPGASEPSEKLSYGQYVPAWDWVLVSGIYVDDVAAIFWRRAMVLGAIGLAVLAAALGLSALIARSVTGPLEGLTANMQRLADGDTGIAVRGTSLRSEIGAFARALEVFRTTAIEQERLRAAQRAEEEKAVVHAKRIADLTARFDAMIGDLLGTVGQHVGQLEDASATLASGAQQTSTQSTVVASASEEASANVQTVAAATEELFAAVTEIGRQVQRSNEIANHAVDQARTTTQTMAGLAESASRIGDVVNLINDIASQTNLLALNATIEAARAGDAGKGFAVVANEVKTLANQTAKATEDITRQIADVQKETQNAVVAIEEVSRTIEQMDEIASSISAAVEEQSAATREISRNVQEAARGTDEVSRNIQGVSDAATSTGAAAGQVHGAASNLQQEAQRLRGEVERFLRDIRAA